MRRAYVGIVSRYGLEALYPEQAHTSAFLLRRAERTAARGAICFWSVMAPEIAEQIRAEMDADRLPEALILLQTLAGELGRILPEVKEPVVVTLE